MALVTRDFARTTFRPRHRRLVRALAEALFSEDGDVESARLDALVSEVDRFVSAASRTLRVSLLGVLELLRVSPLLFGCGTLFDNLTLPKRVAHLARLERSRVLPLSLLVVSYKTMMTIIYYEDESELREMGYRGAERTREKRALAVLS